MINSPATRAVEMLRPVVMAMGATSAALAGDHIAIMFCIVALTVALTIRLYSLTH